MDNFSNDIHSHTCSDILCFVLLIHIKLKSHWLSFFCFNTKVVKVSNSCKSWYVWHFNDHTTSYICYFKWYTAFSVHYSYNCWVLEKIYGTASYSKESNFTELLQQVLVVSDKITTAQDIQQYLNAGREILDSCHSHDSLNHRSWNWEWLQNWFLTNSGDRVPKPTVSKGEFCPQRYKNPATSQDLPPLPLHWVCKH